MVYRNYGRVMGFKSSHAFSLESKNHLLIHLSAEIFGPPLFIGAIVATWIWVGVSRTGNPETELKVT